MLTPRRAARALALRYDVYANRGTTVRCPICEHRFARFRDDWNRPAAICWRCGSHERHRALWLYLEGNPELLTGASSLLHFAPEWCLEHPLRRRAGLRYVTADLNPRGVDLTLDITALALADGSFEVILCSHVLEHVEDDHAAMSELRRVLSPGGTAIVMVPLDTGREHSYEDPAITAPEERRRAFWQDDHLRLYAPDIADRLAAAGFAVSVERMTERLGAADARTYGLLDSDWLFVCR